LFTLDTHLHHFAQNSLLELGGWLRRKLEVVDIKQRKAINMLQKIEYTQDELRAAWKDQLEMQTKDVPRE